MKRLVLSTAVLALACAGVGSATAAPSVYKVTGGGQITQGLTQGAGSTLAFTAQSDGGAEQADGSNAKGQFQLQERVLDEDGKGTGQGGTSIHGVVTCVTVFSTGEGGMAVIGGYSRDTNEVFHIDVTDDGQGGDTLDLVSVRRGTAAQDGVDKGDDGRDTALCDREDSSENASMAFGHGNVKIHAVRS